MDKESSDQVASWGAHIMRNGNPLKDDGLVDQIIRNVVDAHATGTLEDARNALREPLMQFCNTAVSLAGSVVSQANGQQA